MRRGVWIAGLGVMLASVLLGRAVQGQAAPLPPGTNDTESAGTRVSNKESAPLAEAEEKLSAGEYAGAATLLDAYLSAHPGDARALFDRGYVEDAQGKPAVAEGYYRKAIAADPQQFESRLALGLMLAARSQTAGDGAAGQNAVDEARKQLEAATRLEPKPPNPAAQAQAGRALAQLLHASDPEAARQALLGALNLSTETPADTLLAAEIAEGLGDPETAENAYRRAMAAAPGGSPEGLQATEGLAHLLITQGKYADAEPMLRGALERNPNDAVLNSQLANVLVAQDKPEAAIAVLEKLHGVSPEDRNVARLLADLYTQSGQAAKADPLYVAMLSGDTPDAGLLASRGDNLVRQKRFAEAIPVLKQATGLDPQNGDAWSSLAFAASEGHDPQLTLDALAMRSKVMTETPATYFLRATACDTLHQTKRAVEMYKQFLAVAGGRFPDEEWQARHRLVALAH